MSDKTSKGLSVILVLSGLVGLSAWLFDATPKQSAGAATIGFLVMAAVYAIARAIGESQA